MYLIVGFLLGLTAVVFAVAGDPELSTCLSVATLLWVASRPAFPRPLAYGLLPEVRCLDRDEPSTGVPEPWRWGYHGQLKERPR